VRSRQTGSQFLFESSRDRIPATRQCPDDNPVGGIQFIQERARDMPQPTGNSMPLNGGPHRLADDKPDAWPSLVGLRAPLRMHDEIAFGCPHTRADC
jgi:hypothetical protein